MRPQEMTMAGRKSDSDDPLNAADAQRRRLSRGAKLAPWQVKLAQDEMALRLRGGLRIADIATKLGLSLTHFAKAYKNSVGVPPYSWYLRERISEAMRLLSAGQLSLSEIASECGFFDESHFTTIFGDTVGVSPGRWRKRQCGTRAAGDEQLLGALVTPSREISETC
jgi:transcriptional regulator GlxA family with amidase domain